MRVMRTVLVFTPMRRTVSLKRKTKTGNKEQDLSFGSPTNERTVKSSATDNKPVAIPRPVVPVRRANAVTIAQKIRADTILTARAGPACVANFGSIEVSLCTNVRKPLANDLRSIALR